MRATLTGGCLSGAIRDRYQGTLGAAFNCHCSICRRSAGAPFLAWQTPDRFEAMPPDWPL